jgi:hypothetical protein
MLGHAPISSTPISAIDLVVTQVFLSAHVGASARARAGLSGTAAFAAHVGVATKAGTRFGATAHFSAHIGAASKTAPHALLATALAAHIGASSRSRAFLEISHRRVTQLSPEIASDDTPSARVSQLAAEIAATDTPSARVSQLVPEIAADDVPGARVSQLVPEVAHADIPGARVSGVWLEYAVANYYQPPPPQIFPSLPGLTFPVTTRPRFLNLAPVQHTSGREVRGAYSALPVWEFEVDFEFLRDTPSGFTEFAEMLGFFFAQVGSRNFFLFRNPSDNQVTGQSFVTTTGRSVFGPLVRTYCGSTEPVGYVDTSSSFTLYANGGRVDPSDYFVLRDAPGNQLIKFRDTPAAGQALTVDMSFFYVCRFAGDSLDFEKFMQRLYALAKVKLIAPRDRKSLAGSVFGFVTN